MTRAGAQVGRLGSAEGGGACVFMNAREAGRRGRRLNSLTRGAHRPTVIHGYQAECSPVEHLRTIFGRWARWV
eukprot:6035242-Prymnesium_polylepis.1